MRAEDSQAPVRATLFVAVNGNDAWSGRLAAPNAPRSDGPLATLAKARDKLRDLPRQPGAPRVVMVRGGKHFLDQTLVLGPPDGGTRDAPVVYTAYPGEKPVLSGGRKLGGWEPYRGSIFQCSVPEAKGGRWTFRRLWANGKVQVRARTPKLDPHDSTGGAKYGVAYVNGVSNRTPEMAGFFGGNRFCRNIVVDCAANVLYPGNRFRDRAVAQSDYNLIYNAADGSAYLDNQRRQGFEAHSLAADPMFVDPARGDYRLRPQSPAWQLGFQPIDLRRIGPNGTAGSGPAPAGE